MHHLGPVRPRAAAGAEQKELAPTGPGSQHRHVGAAGKAQPPVWRQGQPQPLGPVEHPDQRNIGQRARHLMIAKLAADIAMRAAKPHLFHPPRLSRRAVPQHRGKGRAGFMQRQRVKPVTDHRAKVMVVKIMFRRGQQPQQRQPQAQGLDGVPGPDHLDLDPRMAIGGGKGPRGVRTGGQLVMAVGLGDVAHGRHVGCQQPDLVDDPRQAAHRIGPARIAEQEYPVTRTVARGEKAIGPADLAIDAPALDHVIDLPPALPLDTRLIIQRHPTLGHHL